MAAAPPMSTAFAKWLLNSPARNYSLRNELRKCALQLLQVTTFIVLRSPLDAVESEEFFQPRALSIRKVSIGSVIFNFKDIDA